MNIAARFFSAFCARSDAKRDAGLTIPADIEYVRGVKYGGSPENTLHIAYPKGAADILPTIISVHGGGYVYGSAELYRFYAADLARRGFAVVNFNYRLAPGHTFPAPLEDLNVVMEWVLRNREAFPFDTENIFIVGDSAGAQLTSQYAAICSNPAYAEVMSIYPPKFNLRAVGLNCGMYDLLAKSSLSGITSDYFTENPEIYGGKLRVLDYINENYPPAYLFSAPKDFLLDSLEPMARLLRSRGITAEYKVYGDENTGHVFHLDLRNPYGKEANDDEIAFFKRYIVSKS